VTHLTAYLQVVALHICSCSSFHRVEAAILQQGAAALSPCLRGVEVDVPTQPRTVEGGGGTLDQLHARDSRQVDIFGCGDAVGGGDGNVVQVGSDAVGVVGCAAAQAPDDDTAGGIGAAVHVDARHGMKDAGEVVAVAPLHLLTGEEGDAAGELVVPRVELVGVDDHLTEPDGVCFLVCALLRQGTYRNNQ